MNRIKEYLNDIIESIEKIEKYTKGMTYHEYAEDNKTIDGVERNFIKLGDIINRISKDFQKTHNSIPWKEMVSIRNVLTHEYKEVKDEIVWNTTKDDLPKTKAMIKKIVEKI